MSISDLQAAKNYKEAKRVGLAEISPGVVLYVCPRSDNIITILAKYGFFKGKAVLEGDQDSLIGCVVWRRNRTSSVLSKIFEKKALSQVGQSVESPSDALVVKPLHERHINPNPPSVMEAASQISEAIEDTKDPPNVDELLSKTVPKTADTVQDKSQIKSGELHSTARHDLISVRTPRELVTDITPTGAKRNNTDEVPSDPLHPDGPPHGLGTRKRYAASTDDDDLPEFDFSSACGSSLPCLANELRLLDEKEHISERRDEGDSVPLLPVSNVIGNNHQRVPVPQPPAFQLPAASPRADSCPSQKNIWDDDDNIPEWSPPDGQHKALPSPLTALTAQRSPPWPLMPRNPTAQVLPPYCPSVQMRPIAATLNSAYAPGYGDTDLASRPRFSEFDRGRRVYWRGARS